jgi:N-glycosylase/DNA lyase
MNLLIAEIKKIHKSIQDDIKKQLAGFKKIWESGNDKDLFREMAFCILTPQSKARSGWRAICNLLEKNLLFNGCYDDVNKELNIVRFKNKKAHYLLDARKKFTGDGNISIREMLNRFEDIEDKRDWLVKEIKGYGYKEASHFLRNIGLGREITILDRHILKNLKLLNVIDKIPESITRNKYMEIEQKMKAFAKEIKIPVDHLDFVLWYKEAGEVFK